MIKHLLTCLLAAGLATPSLAEPTPNRVLIPAANQNAPRQVVIDSNRLGGPPQQKVKDLVRAAGLNGHNLTGYGLVVGLPNTGDSSNSLTSPMMTHLLRRMGLEPMLDNVRNMKSKNIAVVAITAVLPPVVRSGDPISVEAASIGDAKSLSQGVLLRSILRGPDNEIYASAQGRVTSLSIDEENRVIGRIANGGTVSRNLESPALTRKTLMLTLLRPDLATANRIANKIGLRLSVPCRAISEQLVEVNLESSGMTAISALSVIQGLNVRVGDGATIVIDRHSKSVVVGGAIPLRPALITHNGVTIEIGAGGSTLKKVLESLAKMGSSSEDIVAILESLRQVGSLSGQIEYR